MATGDLRDIIRETVLGLPSINCFFFCFCFFGALYHTLLPQLRKQRWLGSLSRAKANAEKTNGDKAGGPSSQLSAGARLQT